MVKTHIRGSRYNKINGVWSCENPETLGNLKKDLGFEGWVMSDWGATHSTSIMAGLDQEMPGAADMNEAAIKAGIAAKNITDKAVDESVERILTGMFLAGVMDKFAEDKTAYDFSKHSANVTSESAAQLARELSANSTVLLKNEGGVLPLTTSDKVAIIGLGDQDNALTHGGGSGQVTPSWTITPLAGISAAAGKGKVTYDPGNDTASAAAAAKAADVAVVFVGSLSSEGSDRKSLSLDDGSVSAIKEQDALIEAVVAANPKTVVVLTVPGAILMPWSTKVGLLISQLGTFVCDSNRLEYSFVLNLLLLMFPLLPIAAGCWDFHQLYAWPASWSCNCRLLVRKNESFRETAPDYAKQRKRTGFHERAVARCAKDLHRSKGTRCLCTPICSQGHC